MQVTVRTAIIAAEAALNVFLRKFKRNWSAVTHLESTDFISCIDYAIFNELKSTLKQLSDLEITHDYKTNAVETIPLINYLGDPKTKHSFFSKNPNLIDSDELNHLFISLKTGDVFKRFIGAELKA